MEFADGSLIFLAFLVIAFIGVVFGYFTRAGSGIDSHPYGNRYGGAPGAHGAGDYSGRDPRVRMSDWSRGTR